MAMGKSSATRPEGGCTSQPSRGTLDLEGRKASNTEERNKEPRKKVYTSPLEPAPVPSDPLDPLGIAQKQLLLCRPAKKDSITKQCALEDFQAGWIDKARSEGRMVGCWTS